MSKSAKLWLVNDVEKLLDSIEPFDDTSNNEDAQESVLPNIVEDLVLDEIFNFRVDQKMVLAFLSSAVNCVLLYPCMIFMAAKIQLPSSYVTLDLGTILSVSALLNLVEHYKQLQENPLKIPGALHFAPIAGDYEDFDFAEVDDLVVKDIKAMENACYSSFAHTLARAGLTFNNRGVDAHDETGQFLNNQNLHKSSFEDPIPTSRKHCHKASIPGANWDDIPWSSKATVSEIDINPDLPIDEIVDSEADKRKMLNQSTHVQDFLGRESREPENCCGPNKYANDTSDTKSCEHSVLTQVCDILNCPTLETAYVNSGQDDSLLEELADQLNEHSKGGLGVEGLNEDCVDETIECSEEPVGNKIASVVIKHSEEQSGDQIGISFGKVVVQTAGNAEEKSSSQVQISNDVSCGNLPSSDLFETAREDKFDNQVHNIQKQRKRYRLDDLIADVVMAECQFHQQILYHFDLAPLSSSLATGISSLHHGEHLTSISFRQLLEASKVAIKQMPNDSMLVPNGFPIKCMSQKIQNVCPGKHEAEPPSRDLRQGCPFSPSHFITAAELLSRLLILKSEVGLLTGLKLNIYGKERKEKVDALLQLVGKPSLQAWEEAIGFADPNELGTNTGKVDHLEFNHHSKKFGDMLTLAYFTGSSRTMFLHNPSENGTMCLRGCAALRPLLALSPIRGRVARRRWLEPCGMQGDEGGSWCCTAGLDYRVDYALFCGYRSALQGFVSLSLWSLFPICNYGGHASLRMVAMVGFETMSPCISMSNRDDFLVVGRFRSLMKANFGLFLIL
eukprot:Gb_36289 [translate_table: standard]